MKGNCENCARRETCRDVCGIIFGFCDDGTFLPADYAEKLKQAEALRVGDCVVIYKGETGNVYASHASKTAKNIFYAIPRAAEILGYMQD